MTAELIEDVWSRTRGRDWTWADLERLPERDGHRHEIIDGSLHVSASPTPWHQLVVRTLGRLAAGRRRRTACSPWTAWMSTSGRASWSPMSSSCTTPP